MKYDFPNEKTDQGKHNLSRNIKLKQIEVALKYFLILLKQRLNSFIIWFVLFSIFL